MTEWLAGRLVIRIPLEMIYRGQYNIMSARGVIDCCYKLVSRQGPVRACVRACVYHTAFFPHFVCTDIFQCSNVSVEWMHEGM